MLLLLIPLLGVTACRRRGADLPFETIEQWDMGGGYEGTEPKMIVVAQAAEVGALENLVAPASIEQIRALDLDTHFVLAVFQGRKLTDGYAIQVEHITRQEDQVTVLVEIQEPQTDARKNDIVTSPYHLVEVQKAGTWDQDVTFNLVIDDAVVASLSQYVP